MPAVSIITAVGPRSGHQRFLDELYQSLAASSLRDWQWCVQVDCDAEQRTSRDLRVLERAAEKDHRIEPAYNAGRFGISVSRNLAMLRAKSDFAFAIDADDLVKEDTLQRWLTIMESDEELAYTFGTAEILREEAEQGAEREEDPSPLPSGRLEAGQLPEHWLENRSLPMHPQSIMWRRSLALQYGGYAALPNGGDEVLSLALSDVFPIFHDTEVSWVHRLHQESTSRWLGGQEVQQVDGTRHMMDLHRLGEI